MTMPSTDIAFSPAVKSVQERRGRLRSHHIAVGMTKNEQDLLRITWQRQKFPGYSDQLTRHSNALGHIERGIPILAEEEEAKGLASGLRVFHE